MARGVIHAIISLKDRFSEGIRRARGNTEQMQRQVRRVDNQVRQFRQNATNSFKNIVKTTAGVVVAFEGIRAAGSAFTDMVTNINDYRDAMRQFQASTGASVEEMAALKKEISDLYRQNLGENWTDVADAMAKAKQVTGQQGDALKETTKQAIVYRDVFQGDIQESIKAVDTMMRNFGITSSQAYTLMAQGAQQGLDKSGELIDSANEYAPHFAKLGFSADQMFDTFSAGLKAGAFNLDKVGDAVKEFNIRSKDMSATSVEAYKALGFNAEKMSQTFAKGGSTAQKAFSDIVSAISKIKDPVKRNAIGVGLFGTQFEDLESDVISAMGTVQKQFDSTKNTMQEIQKIKYDSVGLAFRGIGRDIETGILIPIADKLLPKLSEFSGWVKSKMPDIQQGMNNAFSIGEKVVNKFTQAIQWAKDNADWLIPVVAGLTAAIIAQKVIGTVTKLYQAWKVATTGMTIAQYALNLAMSLNPIGLVATAIGLLVAAGIYLWRNWDKVKAKAQELWISLTNVWGNIKTFIVDTVGQVGAWLDSFPLGQTFLETIRGVVANVKQIFGGIIDFFKSVFKGDWDGAWNGIVESFKGTFSLIKTYAKAPINGIIDMINYLIEKVNGISVDIPDWVPGVGGETFGVSIPKIPNFALGTSYFKGGLARTDERGGEIKVLPNGTKIYPHDLSKKMVDEQGSGISIQVNVNGNVIGDEDYASYLANVIASKVKLNLGNM